MRRRRLSGLFPLPELGWRPSVMWFDDNAKYVERPQDGLREVGIEVTSFSDPDEVRGHIAACRQHSSALPDVMITDLVIDKAVYEDDDGISLAEFASGAYAAHTKVCGRIGVASGYPKHILTAQQSPRVDFAFYYWTHEIIASSAESVGDFGDFSAAID